MNNINPIEATVLGQKVDYPQHYKPDILVAVPRRINREQYGIDDKNLPFVGIDTWHAYEIGFLTANGLPVQGLLKLTYPADSPAIVESKSLKLYLNSFNMERIGSNADEGRAAVADTVRQDLGRLLQTNVEAHIFGNAQQMSANDFDGYEILENDADAESIVFTDFNENPLILNADTRGGTLDAATHLLRSNCKITRQPDWGSAFIHMRGDSLPTRRSLLQYIVSIRNENHFHEEICEMIYQRLWQKFRPTELMVSCIYTRRGGIDICPSRASHSHLLPQNLTDISTLTPKLLRQ